MSNSPKNLLQIFRASVPSGRRLIVGYSGGLDSSVLLHLAQKAYPQAQILALHCNHGVSDDAAKWRGFCEQNASELGVNFAAVELNLGNAFTEEVGRNARYQAFEEHMSLDSIFLLGHHADDQLETFLFRLFRGTGIKGLTAIAPKRPFAEGLLQRPLLGVSKDELQQFALNEGIQWIEDPSNVDTSYDRNFLRSGLIPVILERWPAAKARVLDTIDALIEEEELLNDFADSLIAHLSIESGALVLNIESMLVLSEAQQRLALRRVLFLKTFKQPNNQVLNEIHSQFLLSTADAEPLLRFANVEIRRFNNKLYFLEHAEPPPLLLKEPISWDGVQPLQLEGIGVLSLIEGSSAPFIIKFRQGGERAKPVDRQHSQTLKKLMQEYQIEPWKRDRLPLVYLNDRLISVADCIRCSGRRFRFVPIA